MRLLRALTVLLVSLLRPLRPDRWPAGFARTLALVAGAAGLAVLVFADPPTILALLLAVFVFSALSGLTPADAAYLLSRLVPVPMRTTYEHLGAGISGRDRATETVSWWQWRGRVYRHRVVDYVRT